MNTVLHLLIYDILKQSYKPVEALVLRYLMSGFRFGHLGDQCISQGGVVNESLLPGRLVRSGHSCAVELLCWNILQRTTIT